MCLCLTVCVWWTQKVRQILSNSLGRYILCFVAVGWVTGRSCNLEKYFFSKLQKILLWRSLEKPILTSGDLWENWLFEQNLKVKMLWLGRCVSGQERRDRLCSCRLSMSMSVTVYLIRTHKSWPQSAVARSCSSDGAGRSCIWLSATVLWRCNPGQVTHTVTMVAFFGTSHLWVIFCSWDGNHRSCVALAMHPTIMMSPRGCKVSSFEPDYPFWGRLVRLKISAWTGHRYTDIYLCIQIQTLNFWLPHGAWQ